MIISQYQIDNEFFQSLLVYENEFKQTKEFLKKEPKVFHLENLRFCFKHLCTNNVDNEPSGSFYFKDLDQYEKISHLTRDKIYIFFAVTPEGCQELRVPTNKKDSSLYTRELTNYILDHPEVLFLEPSASHKDLMQLLGRI